MKAELKSLTSVDIDELTYWPDDEAMFAFNVDAAIGPDTDDSSNSFCFFVCTPNWILSKAINRDFGDFGVFGKHMIVVTEYDWDKIRQLIENLCSDTSGESWNEIARKLARYGRWEFEDHLATSALA